MEDSFNGKDFDEMFEKVEESEKPAVIAAVKALLEGKPWRETASFVESKAGIGMLMFTLATVVTEKKVTEEEFVTLVEARAKLEAICHG